MVTQSTLTKQLKGLSLGLVLSIIPIVVLLFTLIRSGYIEVAWKSLQGKYQIHGIPSNPWLSFLPLFCLPMIVFLGAFWLSSMLLGNSQATVLQTAGGVLLAVLAAAAFGVTMVSASICYLWFRDAPVIGVPASSVFHWLSALIPLIVLGVHSFISRRISP